MFYFSAQYFSVCWFARNTDEGKAPIGNGREPNGGRGGMAVKTSSADTKKGHGAVSCNIEESAKSRGRGVIFDTTKFGQ